MVDEEKKTNEALDASKKYNTVVEEANDYIEHFDILETITNVGNDEVFTPRKTCDMMLDSLPEEVWHNPLYKWLNPATKNGIFEREIALRLDKGLENVITNKEERRKHILKNMIFSIGQTKFTSNVARRTLYYCSQANRKCDGLKASDGHYVNGYAIGNGSWFDDEEGNIKTPCTDHKIDSKTKKCEFCGIAHDSKYLDANQREKYAYEFIHVNHLVLEKHLQKRFFKGEKDMKFDIIIGNPPYQLADGGGMNGVSARPIYHKFVEQAISLKPRYLCMIIPSRWMTGGKGLDDFRDSCLKDKRFKVIHDYENDKEIFPTADIGGGVMYFLWDRNHNDMLDYYIHKDGKTTVDRRFLSTGEGIVVRDFFASKIMEKISHKNSFANIVSARRPFDLGADVFKKNPEYFSETKDGEHSILFYGGDGVPMSKYIKDSVIKNKKLASSYKVFISKTGDPYFRNGRTNKQILRMPFFGEKNTACSETYLTIGCFDTKDEVNAILKYISTKLFRFLVLQKKKTQNVSRDVFEFVPILNFKENKDINWNDDVENINKQLYSLYKLTDEEQKYVEDMIDPFKADGE